MKSIYRYQNPAGATIEREFDLFCAPKEIDGYALVVETSGPPAVLMKGQGWTRKTIGVKEHKVTWGAVEKHMKHCEVSAKAHQEKQIKDLTAKFADSI